MSLLTLGCNCEPDCPPIGASRGPPGIKGDQGILGPVGPQGVNNYSKLTDVFSMPNAGENANLVVDSTEWMGVGQSLALETGGYVTVVQFSSSAIAVVNNPGYPENAVPGTVIGVGKKVSGAGARGAAGQDFILTDPLAIALGGTGQGTQQAGFDALSPLAAKGQMLGFDGMHNLPLLAPAHDGQLVISDTTVPIGFRWADQSELVIAFNSFSPATTKGDLITSNGTTNLRLPVGAQGFVLAADAAQASGLKWVPAAFHTFSHVTVSGPVLVLSGNEDVVGINRGLSPGPTSIVLGALGLYANQFVTIKDEFGDADVNNITITTSDGSNIQTNTSYVINQPFGHVKIYSDGQEFQIL